MNVSDYLARQYHPAEYNCLHFARDVYYELTGIDIRERLEEVFVDPATLGPGHVRAFHAIESPADPCLVVMTRGRETHIGVYLHGRLLQLNPQGASFPQFDLVRPTYRKVRFFTC